MKNLNYYLPALILAFLAISLTSCEKSLFGIDGEGKIITKVYDIEQTNGIVFEAFGNIHLIQSDTQSFVIKAQQNILDNLVISESNKTIYIEFDKDVNSHDGLDIYLSSEYISKAILSGSGKIETQNTFTQTHPVEIGINGSGDADLAFNTSEIQSSLSGSGTLKITTTTDLLITNISGSGTYILDGEAKESEHYISGSGTINAFDLKSETTSFNNSGSAKGQLWATKTLNITISGSGDVYYKGSPTINTNISGSGKLIQMN